MNKFDDRFEEDLEIEIFVVSVLRAMVLEEIICFASLFLSEPLFYFFVFRRVDEDSHLLELLPRNHCSLMREIHYISNRILP